MKIVDSVNNLLVKPHFPIELLNKIEERHPEEKEIFALCDHATYYRSRKVKDYLGFAEKVIFGQNPFFLKQVSIFFVLIVSAYPVRS